MMLQEERPPQHLARSAQRLATARASCRPNARLQQQQQQQHLLLPATATSRYSFVKHCKSVAEI
jgi:hypothetical protein